MRLERGPKGRPGTCAVIPGKAADPAGFVTTNTVLGGWDPQICVSVTGVRELMRVCEFPSPEAHQEVVAERDALLTQVAELEGEIGRLEAFADAVDVIESRDFRARRKPGRKPQKEAVA